MVRKPKFKLIAKGEDITEKLSKNLINISYEDKEKAESDEISLSIFGLYSKPLFGDSLELYLGFEKLFKCGSFSVNVVRKTILQIPLKLEQVLLILVEKAALI